jgi:hypothetical protein
MMVDKSLRDRISNAITQVLRPLPIVFAGWEGGSAAFGAVDEYSDIDLTYLVADDASPDLLYASAERAMEMVSPITGSHNAPPGRYYMLKDGGEFFLVDLSFLLAGAPDHYLEVERHGHILPLFDKGDWLLPRPLDDEALTTKRTKRFRELQIWFVPSQSFPRKAILRGQHAEAMNAYWMTTIKPLAELVRMRYCPVRWDFGMRYLDRDLPPAVYDRVRGLAFAKDLEDLKVKLSTATAWGTALLRDLDSA